MVPPSSMPLTRSPRFLLVDPDPIARAQLRQKLRTLHPKWEIWVATDLVGAVALLERGPIDVLVTELDLGDRRGEELLGIAAARWRTMARIVVSSRRGSPGLAHRRLSKPASDTSLFVAVKTALRLKVELERHACRTTGIRRVLRSIE